MNIIVLGKLREGGIHVVEREDSNGFCAPIRYGDMAGMYAEGWYCYETDSGDGWVRYSLGSDFHLTDYPLVPVAYDNRYALACLVNDYELDDNERLVKVGPASPKMVKETLREMWQ